MFGRHPNRDLPPIPKVRPAEQTDGILAAKRAQLAARDRLLDAVDSAAETRGTVERMRALRAQNHFGPLIEEALREPDQ
jgi:hypothetical protein